MKSPHSSHCFDRLVEPYHQHLIHAAGLAPQTCQQRLRYVRRFLATGLRDIRSRRAFHRLDAPRLLRYIKDLRVQNSLHTLQAHAGSLRSFFRFLTLIGRAPAGLEQALPAVRAPFVPLTAYLSPTQLRVLLRAFDGRRPAGRRDRAMVLLAATLGLRAREIAQLSLEDVDWQAGTLCLRQTKARRCRLLPLPPQVARALVDYLRTVRPRTSSRQLFLCLHRPRALTSGAVSDATVAAFHRAGLKVPRPGPHLLRHTLATHLVQKKTDLKSIADLLGHRSLNTTTRYAKVNIPMLAQVAQGWPEEAP